MTEVAMSTVELLKRLQRHYVKPGAAGGVFASEVSVVGSGGSGSRCDALYAGFTSASGRILIGHELKISRADWRHELDQLHKANTWADAVHEWYVVAPSTEIVPVEELPAGWGLLVVDPRTKTRLKCVVRSAHKTPGWHPPWWAPLSLLARADTLTSADFARRVGQQVEKDVAERVKREVEYQTRTFKSGEGLLTALAAAGLHGYELTNEDVVKEVVESFRDARQVRRATEQARQNLQIKIQRIEEALNPWKETWGDLKAEIELLWGS